MHFAIRPYSPNDYPQLASVLAAAKPYAAVSAEMLQYRDQTRPAICQFQRFVAEAHGDVIGFSYYTQYADMFELGAFWSDVCVLPAQQGQGIGSALLAAIEQSLAGIRPFTLRVQIREDDPASISFAHSRGFQEFGRRWESKLQVADFDAHRHPDYMGKLAEQGIQITAYSDLADDPKRDWKLYQLQTELDQDVPMLVPVTAMSFEQFTHQVLRNPSLVPEGLMIAMHGEEYVGMSSFFADDSRSLVIDLTGTKAAYRRQGIAMALKLAGIQFARQCGYETIVVHNDVVNQGMLAVNEKLGFVREPAMIQYAREF